MFKKIICIIFMLKVIQARYGFIPKFYGQDSAVIVDTDKFLTPNKNSAFGYARKIKMPPPFPIWRHYPRYHIIPQPPPGQIATINTWAKTANAMKSTAMTSSTTSTTTTTTPKPIITTTTSSPSPPPLTVDEFPNELLDIAQNKLGLRNLDEIPSISEFGEILGTNGPEETLKYIKQLTLNEQGVALIKAYIESTDYTDNTGDLNNNKNNNKNDDVITAKQDEINDTNDEGLIVITDDESNGDYDLNDESEQMEDDDSGKIILKTPEKISETIIEPKELTQNQTSFMERLTNYMHINNLLHKKDNKNTEFDQLNRITENGKTIINKQKSHSSIDEQEDETEFKTTQQLEPKEIDLKPAVLVRDSIPYNYPVPIRVQTTISPTSTESPVNPYNSSKTPVVHLNTPKNIIPHIQQLLRVSKIPSQQIEDFLATKPKLLELATKVSRFPIVYDRNSPIEAQILAAVKKAFEQDKDLQKLLSSNATLK